MRSLRDMRDPCQHAPEVSIVRHLLGKFRTKLDEEAEPPPSECRRQVRSEKSCVIGGESPSSLEARLPEFGTK